MFYVGLIGWGVFASMAILCAFAPEYHTVAIVTAITGAGYGIMMQIVAKN